jgi:hypothetical protein
LFKEGVSYMKTSWRLVVTTGLLGLVAAAQTTNGTASGNVSVTPGQTAADAKTNQSVQAPGASANVNASGQAQASGGQQQKGSQATASGNGSSSATVTGSGASSAAALSSGTTLQAELTKPLDARKAKPGDEVTAKVTHDVKADGKVVIHKGSQLIGHVTEAQARSKEHADSRLGIAFDKAVLKGGQELSFNGMVQALAPPVQATLSTATEENSMLSAPAPASGGSRSSGGGLLGGVTTTTTGTVSGATKTVTGATTGTVNGAVAGTSAVAGGLTAQGNLTSASRGAIGLQGLTLNSVAAGSAQGSVISSTSRNVKLDSGTQMLLQVSGAAH